MTIQKFVSERAQQYLTPFVVELPVFLTVALQRASRAEKLLEIVAGAAKNTRRSAGVWSTNELMRTAERELAEQAETSYKRMVQDQQAGAPAKVGASATPERASI